MYSVPVGACVSSVFPPDFSLVCAYEGGDLFVWLRYAGMLWRVLLVQFLCIILLRMSCGRSLSVLRILPTVLYFFPAW